MGYSRNAFILRAVVWRFKVLFLKGFFINFFIILQPLKK